MLLRNKKTGEIATLTLSSNGEDMIIMGNDMYAHITKLSELNDYEDYEEPKEYWYIDWTPEIGVYHTRDVDSDADNRQKQIGNYFETREEAEKAVEKLKAWKRLKDKGFRFDNWDLDADDEDVNVLLRSDKYKGNQVYALEEDLDLLFGGEE